MTSIVRKIRLFVFVACAISIPIVYNSCSDEVKTFESSSNNAATVSCKSSNFKMKADKNLIQRLEKHEETLNSAPAFATGPKLRLNLNSNSSPSQKLGQKVSKIKEEISVLVNLECARSNEDSLAWNFIKDTRLDPEWRIQAFTANVEDLIMIPDYSLKIESDNCIKGIAPNHVYVLQSRATPFQITDAYATSLSHLRALKAQLGLGYFYHPTVGIQSTTQKVKVAVLDTGIQHTHKEFLNQFHRFDPTHLWWGRDVTQDHLLGEGTQINNVQDISSDSHGTHVAGIIGAHVNNGIGVAGIASKAVSIMNYKVFTSNPAIIPTCQSGSLCTTSTIVANAIHDAIKSENGAKVINLSLGRLAGENESKTDEIYRNAIAQAVAAGTVVVLAGGNSSSTVGAQRIDDSSFTVIPARYGKDFNGAITVGSTNINYNGDILGKSLFSHYSINHIEIGAPGSEGDNGFWSTSKIIGANGIGGYKQMIGTSVSAPMVSAAAALAIAMFRQTYGVDPTPAAVEDWILSSARKIPSLNSYFKDGNALDLNGLALLLKARMPEVFSGATSCP